MPSLSSSPEVLSKVKTWLSNCVVGHNECRPDQATSMPTRLLETRLDDGDIVVRVIECCSQRLPYLTLSYCWGGAVPLRTTEDNLEDHKHAISSSRLPQTFRDAIDLTRYLGYSYLWIDAL